MVVLAGEVRELPSSLSFPSRRSLSVHRVSLSALLHVNQAAILTVGAIALPVDALDWRLRLAVGREIGLLEMRCRSTVVDASHLAGEFVQIGSRIARDKQLCLVAVPR